jgi:queuine tRNA-ribosyltransferase
MKTEQDFEVVTTRSGARAMRDRQSGELMHPVVGPMVEAETLYVWPSRLEERLREPAPEPLVLFDVGLGAASNAIAAWKVAQAHTSPGRLLNIVSFERNVAALELALADEHAAAFGLEGEAGEAARALLQTGEHRNERTHWRLVRGDLGATLAQQDPASADIVYWDPFSPRANPELWTTSSFTDLRRACRDGATVHTYSASTSVRSALLLAGFVVGTGDATGEKKQTTIGATRLSDLKRPLDRGWVDRLSRSSAPLPSDAPADAIALLSALPQFTEQPA